MIPPKPHRRRVLFVGEGVTLAHVARPLALAETLDPDEFDVHFACAERYEPLLRHRRFTYWPIDSLAPEAFLRSLATGSPPYDYRRLTSYVAEDRKILDATRPDVVIGDFRLSLIVSAPQKAVPHVAIANAYWSPFRSEKAFPVPEHPSVRWFGLAAVSAIYPLLRPIFFSRYAKPMNRLLLDHGRPRLGDLCEIYSHGDHTLYSDVPSLAPTTALPAGHQYLGPVVWSPRVTLPPWWNELPNIPLVYVSLGSSGETSTIPMILEALRGLGVGVILATAGRYRSSGLPGRVWAADYLPGSEAARRSRLVICNGGSPTVYQALREGVPVLGIPSNLDQYLCMSSARRAGAATYLRAGKLTVAGIRNAVSALLEEPRYRARAGALAREIRAWDGAARFAPWLRQWFGREAGQSPRLIDNLENATEPESQRAGSLGQR